MGSIPTVPAWRPPAGSAYACLPFKQPLLGCSEVSAWLGQQVEAMPEQAAESGEAPS